jgi:ppGpp synthetase/RelA/SpoT-type nucleotidyltranferase
VIVRVGEWPVEVQVRTELQHLWAETSEKLSDVSDPSIKYGGGTEDVRRVLERMRDVVLKCETVERRLSALPDEQPQKATMALEVSKVREEFQADIREVLRSLERKGK